MVTKCILLFFGWRVLWNVLGCNLDIFPKMDPYGMTVRVYVMWHLFERVGSNIHRASVFLISGRRRLGRFLFEPRMLFTKAHVTMVALPVGEDFSAVLTVVRSAQVNSLHVVVQLLLVREVQQTSLAGVRFHLPVHAVQVDANVRLVGERFSALVAGVRLELVVDGPLVLFEGGLFGEVFVALGALVGLDLLVDAADVTVENLFGHEFLMAHVALPGALLVMDRFHVNVLGAALLEDVGAKGTLESGGSVESQGSDLRLVQSFESRIGLKSVEIDRVLEGGYGRDVGPGHLVAFVEIEGRKRRVLCPVVSGGAKYLTRGKGVGHTGVFRGILFSPFYDGDLNLDGNVAVLAQ